MGKLSVHYIINEMRRRYFPLGVEPQSLMRESRGQASMYMLRQAIEA
jgi:hypothetical protein